MRTLILVVLLASCGLSPRAQECFDLHDEAVNRNQKGIQGNAGQCNVCSEGCPDEEGGLWHVWGTTYEGELEKGHRGQCEMDWLRADIYSGWEEQCGKPGK